MSNTVFKTFYDLDEAKRTSQLLTEANIANQLRDDAPSVDPMFTGGNPNRSYELFIAQDDFEKANQLLDQQASNVVDQIDESHYLYQFSETELYDILLKPDEWNELDQQLAKKILAEKGEVIDEELLTSVKRQRLETLAQPEETSQAWIASGYSLWLSEKRYPMVKKLGDILPQLKNTVKTHVILAQ